MKYTGAVASTNSEEMHVKHGYFRRKWRKTKADVIAAFLNKYRKCVCNIKECLQETSESENQRRRSQAKLHPLPDKKIRRAASNLKRTPTNELERLRKKGDDWTANDLFRFQYSDPEEGSPDERKILCNEWLGRLQKIQKKFCYLAWYASAIHACYYRLAPLLKEAEEKKRVWEEVKREYAEIFLMGRRIWRRPTHPSRLRVFYDMAVLCTRFGEVPDDATLRLFRDLLSDKDNFDFRVLNEIQFANSIDKVVRLENHVIDQFYSRRRSVGSRCSSTRSRPSSMREQSREAGEKTPSRSRPSSFRDSDRESNAFADQEFRKRTDRPPLTSEQSFDQPSCSYDPVPLSLEDGDDGKYGESKELKDQIKSILVPSIVVEGPDGLKTVSNSRNGSRRGSLNRPASPKPAVRFDDSTTDQND